MIVRRSETLSREKTFTGSSLMTSIDDALMTYDADSDVDDAIAARWTLTEGRRTTTEILRMWPLVVMHSPLSVLGSVTSLSTEFLSIRCNRLGISELLTSPRISAHGRCSAK